MTNKSTQYGSQLSAEMLKNPGPALNAAFEELRSVETADVSPAVQEQPIKPFLELSARHPYDQQGLIDGLWVGRWDTTSDQIFMNPIVVTGPGQWTGTALYGNFKAPANSNYRVVANFYGYQISMTLNGPWGSKVATSVNNTPIALAGECPGTAGQSLWFTMACTGLYLGFAQKIQIFKI
jgi:hypothetical protein